VIGRAAIELLLDRPETKSPFFFPADWGEGHFVGVVRILDRVCAIAGRGRRQGSRRPCPARSGFGEGS